MVACGVAVAACYCISFLLLFAVFRIRYYGIFSLQWPSPRSRSSSASWNAHGWRWKALLLLTTYIANGNQISFLSFSIRTLAFFSFYSFHSRFYGLCVYVCEVTHDSHITFRKMCVHSECRRIESMRQSHNFFRFLPSFAVQRKSCISSAHNEKPSTNTKIWWKDSAHEQSEKDLSMSVWNNGSVCVHVSQTVRTESSARWKK